jgi:wobble nucleotide-excising tRNase
MPTPAEERFKTLDSISGLGLFRTFTWDPAQLADFDRYNLIYGWNYSGKTTLSRVFQSLEDNRIHPDFTGATLQFTKGDGSTISSTFAPPLPQVRVFNREFVIRNFHDGTDMTGADLIAVIGETNQALKDRLERYQGRVQKISDFRTRLIEQRDAVQRSLDDAATAQARTINEIVGGPFTRTHLLRHTIPALPREFTPLPLSEDELNAAKEQFRRAGDFEQVDHFQPNHSSFPRVVQGIRDSLKEIATNTAMAVLQQNRALERWVETGLEVNAPETPCGFCGAPVSAERWAELRGHFSEAFADLQKRLQDHKTSLEALSFNAPTLNETTLFPELRVRFRETLGNLRTGLENAKTATDQIVAQLSTKLANLESSIEWQPDFGPAKELRAAIEELNKVISTHNEKVAGADDVRNAAKKKICQHFAVDYLRAQQVLQRKEEISSKDARISQCSNATATIGAKISGVNQEIRDASIAAQKVNENLAVLLPGDDIEAVKLNDTDFQFRRGTRVATHMSEGERTAVALSYFLAKLEEGPSPLEETIVVVDDPISSLDENHIYAVHSICENRLAEARQLFVLTHNSSFFGMTKDWMKGKASSFYMTQRSQDTNHEWYSDIVPLPRMLFKFKSNYQYTYCCLKLIHENQNPTLEELAVAPNMIRSVLEAYLGFIFPEKGSLGDKLPNIIACEETCGKVLKFANENSHAHSLTQATEIAAYIVHGKQVVADVLGAIQTHNPEHVVSLETEFQNEAANLP